LLARQRVKPRRWVRARQLADQWRIAVVLIAILVAAITPTVDPVNMALVMLPRVLLYGLNILGAAVAGASYRSRQGLPAKPGKRQTGPPQGSK